MKERMNSPETTAKLTPRGKLVAIGAVAAAAVMIGPKVVEATEPMSCEVVGSHTMASGETVWGDVAQPLNDGSESMNDTMAKIDSVNPELDLGQTIQPGTEVKIPGSC